MSIATESLSFGIRQRVAEAERDAREIAKEHGVKVRKNRYAGIDVTFPEGEKKHFHGWFELRGYLVRAYDLAD